MSDIDVQVEKTKLNTGLKHPAIKRREESFSKKITTKIWLEKPDNENPYNVSSSFCHGYSLGELITKKRFSDVLFLLFQGELPEKDQAKFFEALQIGLINLGPRHPATRAAMNAGIGKTDLAHILPISLTVLGGEYLGAVEVERSVRFLRKNLRRNPSEIANSLYEELDIQRPGDLHIAPGFGSRFGSIDGAVKEVVQVLLSCKGVGQAMDWANEFANSIANYNMGWLSTGLAAAAFCDLGFQPRVGPGLYQLLCAPGLYAHGIEQAGKSLTDMPFPEDKDYVLESELGE